MNLDVEKKVKQLMPLQILQLKIDYFIIPNEFKHNGLKKYVKRWDQGNAPHKFEIEVFEKECFYLYGVLYKQVIQIILSVWTDMCILYDNILSQNILGSNIWYKTIINY